MTTGWLLINIALAVVVTALVAGAAVLVPLRLDRVVTTTSHRRTVAPLAAREGRWAAEGRARAQAA